MHESGCAWWSPRGLLDELPEQELFGEGHALELEQLHVLLHASIQREADLPWTREDVGILDGRLVHHVERTRRRIALDDVERFAVIVAGAIEPCLFALSRHVDDKSLTLPSSARPSHPRVGGRVLLPVHAHDTRRAGELVREQDVRARPLHDLKWERHVGGARHTGHVALHLRIAEVVPRLVAAHVDAQAVVEVALLLRERLRLVGNLAAFDDALSRRAGRVRAAELGMWTRLGVVILQIPVGGHHRLPHAVQIGMAVGRALRAERGRELWCRRWPLLTEQRWRREPEQSDDAGQTRIRDRAPKLHPAPPRVARCRGSCCSAHGLGPSRKTRGVEWRPSWSWSWS